MTNVTVDTKMLCTNLLRCPSDTGEDKLWYTEGEKYLYEKIIPKCIHDIPFTVLDIDFSAFDEDDIVSIIDDRISDIEDVFCTISRISEAFTECRPLILRSKKFF